MEDIFLVIITIILFFFGFEVRPWLVIKHPESRHSIDLMILAVTFTTILIPLILIIVDGRIPLGTYIIVLSFLLGYLFYYGFKNRNEIFGRSRRTFIMLFAIYFYIFLSSGIILSWLAPYMPKIII